MRRKIEAEQGRMELGPQELEENAKIINKFRKKYHKKSKEHVIKKTNLGEDLLTFTPDEYARLQLIDEYQEKGFKYRETITEEVNNDHAKKSAVDRLKQLAKLDDVMEEVRCNFEWGTLPEHMRTISSLVKSASSKQLGFQKRIAFQPSCNNLLNIKTEDDAGNTKDNYKLAKSLNKYYFTLLNKRTVGKKQFLFTRADMTVRAEELSLG